MGKGMIKVMRGERGASRMKKKRYSLLVIRYSLNKRPWNDGTVEYWNDGIMECWVKYISSP